MVSGKMVGGAGLPYCNGRQPYYCGCKNIEKIKAIRIIRLKKE